MRRCFSSSSSTAGLFGVDHVNWFPGHMAKALRQLTDRVKQSHVVIEVRDARAPRASSSHAALEEVLASRPRIVLFNKTDLVSGHDRARIAAEWPGALCVEARKRASLRVVFSAIEESVTRRFRTLPSIVLVVGFPNVGKSSLINGMRHLALGKGRVAKVGALPGVTRHMAGFAVSKDPPVHVVDSPGIMVPTFAPGEEGLRRGLALALVGGIPDHVVGVEPLYRFLFWRMRELGLLAQLGRAYGCAAEDGGAAGVSDADEMKEWIRTALGGKADDERCFRDVVARFRAGKLGKFSLWV